jgi:uncharacterized protein (TIGR02757 family)
MDNPDLKKTLDELYVTYHMDYLSSDPLELVREYKDPRDQELVGFIAALLALGRADLIKNAVRSILERMGGSPHRFIRSFDPSKDGEVFNGFVYRFYRGRNVGLLVWWLKQILQGEGSIKAFFLRRYGESDENIGPSLSRFVRAILKLETEPFYPFLPRRGSGVRHWLADPSDGSGCKRLNLFLRWMVRCDGLDLGLWPEVSSSQLVIPLDTHIARIGRRIGLTKRASPDWKMALEITESLKKFDSQDPVKYDFALCRVGMLNGCPVKPNPVVCSSCPLFLFCENSFH